MVFHMTWNLLELLLSREVWCHVPEQASNIYPVLFLASELGP
jgi:hypothetical protein